MSDETLFDVVISGGRVMDPESGPGLWAQPGHQ